MGRKPRVGCDVTVQAKVGEHVTRMDTDNPGVTVIGWESKMNTDAAARRRETLCHEMPVGT